MKVKPIDSHASRSRQRSRLLGHALLLRQGWPPARGGEDPRAGLQRSRQPGPTGATPNCSLDEPANTDNGGMCNNCERHILWAEMMQAPEIGQ